MFIILLNNAGIDEEECDHTNIGQTQTTQIKHTAANRQPRNRRPHEPKNILHQKPQASRADHHLRVGLCHRRCPDQVQNIAAGNILQQLRHQPHLLVLGQID